MVSVVSKESLLKNLYWESLLGLSFLAIAWLGFARVWLAKVFDGLAKQQVPIDSEELDLGLFDPPHQGETGDGKAATCIATALDQDCLEAVLGYSMVRLVSDPFSEVFSHRLRFWGFLVRWMVHD